MTRTFFVGGNWKMNGSQALIQSLSEALNAVEYGNTEVVLAPPAPYLSHARKAFKASIGVAAQNAYFEKSGAFTGEISVEMLKDLNIDYLILGHSERREIFRESDETIGKKITFALSSSPTLKIIACIGEKLNERETNTTFDVLLTQLTAIKSAIKDLKDWERVVIAYEPVWAIGTGKVASPAQAQEVHAWIRKWLKENVSEAVAGGMRIIYGGSVKPGNCVELSKEEDVDGFLVGGAAISPDFAKICSCKL